MCTDAVACWTRKRVFWGGHSYGFNKFLYDYFPIMRKPLLETMKNNSINYLLVWNRYLKSLEDVNIIEE